ncbi:hypothetical protein ABZ464_47635 [Streptomyces sp. NPDC005820]|uniref:hypothetical protein n=1 Tax=Streptomyces sp. NPDC005820 TaxID=3157069 RepID=UPI0033E0E6A3
MTAMFAVLMGVGMVCVAGMAVIGLVAVTTGWTPRFTGIEERPRLWGVGVLLSAFGLTAFLFLGPLNSTPHLHRNLPLVGMGLNLAGLALQSYARRPGPLPRPSTRTSAS